jgi:hypothetical protein
MSIKDKIQALELTSLGAAVFNNTYQAINPLGFEGPVNQLTINNYTDKAIFISYDGVKNHGFIQPDSSLTVYAQQNSQPTNNKCLFTKGTIVYLKSAIAGAGDVYLSGFYQ